MESVDLAREAAHEMRKPLVRAIEAIGLSESLDEVLNIENLSQTIKMMDYILEFVEIATEPSTVDVADMGQALHIAVEQVGTTESTVVFQEQLPSVQLSINGPV